MSSIFVSYRRQDSAPAAGRLAEALAVHYGPDKVFLDFANIAPGVDFRRHIEGAIAEADAVVVVIGPSWLQAAGRDGDRYLNNPNDFVRSEIRAALAHDKPVVPVLVGGAEIPASDLLPQDIAALSRMQAVRVEPQSWARDVAELTRRLSGAERPWWAKVLPWKK